MTIVSLEADIIGKDKAFKAELSDGSSLLFTTEYLPDEGSEVAIPETGRELSSGEEEVLRFAAACYRAEKVALRLIARAEQNSPGLKAKLERRFHDAAVAKAVVSCFRNRNLLNDGRYAKLWIRSRLSVKKALSPRWLLVYLGKKGIDRYSSQKALKEVLDPETEYALLLKYLEKAGKGNSGVSENKTEINNVNENEKFLKTKLKYEGFSSAAMDMYFNN